MLSIMTLVTTFPVNQCLMITNLISVSYTHLDVYKRQAQASATVYSITETALLNGLKPYNYLTYVMEKMKELGAFCLLYTS